MAEDLKQVWKKSPFQKLPQKLSLKIISKWFLELLRILLVV